MEIVSISTLLCECKQTDHLRNNKIFDIRVKQSNFQRMPNASRFMYRCDVGHDY